MAERAAHLVDHVFPRVVVRQWVLSLPHRLRYLLAWDHELCRAVVAVYLRTLLGFLRRRARREGVADGRSGAVAIIQRFGGALNLNVHVHALVLDGVFTNDGCGVLSFHPTPRLDGDDVAAALATVERRIVRLLERRGLADGDVGCSVPDSWVEEAPVLAGIAAASVQGLVALGPRAGARVRKLRDPLEQVETPALGRCHARRHGFDLHAGIVAPAGHRERLERLCRYALRPPVAQDRLRPTGDGQVLLELRRRWSDGTTHLLFDPIELLERLAALTPRPRINLILYHGVLAPRAAWRSLVVARGETVSACDARAVETETGQGDVQGARPRRDSSQMWADLMRRTFGFNVLACPRCSGRMRLVALIEDGAVIQRILGHLGLPTDIPEPRPARAPPTAPNTRRVIEGADVGAFDPCS